MTVAEASWAGVEDTPLLRLTETRFDVFITIDQNLRYQQHLQSSSLAVVVLIAKNNMYATLLPLMQDVLVALETIEPGNPVSIGKRD